MSQYDMAITGTNSGTELVAALGSWEAALLSCHSGSTRPSYSVAKTIWVNDATTPWVVYMYDGADDIQIGTINATTNKFIATDDTVARLTGASFTGTINEALGTSIASSSTINLTTATGNLVHVTGTTTITTVTLGSGMRREVIFDSTLTLTHHTTDNNLPGGANITTAANDRASYWSDGTTVYCTHYQKADGRAIISSTLKYTSSDQTITSGGLLTLAHGLTSEPFDVRVELVNVTAEAGYTTGQVVRTIDLTSNGSGTNGGVSIRTDATNIYVRIGSGAAPFSLNDATTGAGAVLTNANWKLRIKAWV